MKKTFLTLTVSSLLASNAYALEIELNGIKNGERIPDRFAFCVPDGKGKTQNGGNINPQVRWKGTPKGTKSFALLVVDPDVPATFDDANQEGKTIAEDFPRQNFYHWVLVDIPKGLAAIRQGQDSGGHVEGGKPTGKTSYGVNGKNDYASFMKGTFGGYDGPCPPWNDARLHRYHFRLYAVDTETLGLAGDFTGKDAEAALANHTLAMAEIIGTFSNAQ